MCVHGKGFHGNWMHESMQSTTVQCLQGNESVVDDGDTLPVFRGLDTPLAMKAPFGKGA